MVQIKITHSPGLLTGKQGSACPATFTTLIHTAQGREEVLLVDTSLLCLAQLVREDIQHQLTVTIGIDMTVSLQVKILLQFWRVDEVAVVGQANAVGAVHVERLGLRIRTAPSGRVTKVTNSHRSREIGNFGTVMEDLSCHAVGLQLVDPTTGSTGCDSGCILTTICCDTAPGLVCVPCISNAIDASG